MNVEKTRKITQKVELKHIKKLIMEEAKNGNWRLHYCQPLSEKTINILEKTGYDVHTDYSGYFIYWYEHTEEEEVEE